jgi:hypothetical protein
MARHMLLTTQKSVDGSETSTALGPSGLALSELGNQDQSEAACTVVRTSRMSDGATPFTAQPGVRSLPGNTVLVNGNMMIKKLTYRGRHRKSSPGTVVKASAVSAAVLAGSLAFGGVASAAQPTDVWDQLAQCESGGNWSINTGNGFYGGLQHTLSTWRAFGGSGFGVNPRTSLAGKLFFGAWMLRVTWKSFSVLST